MYPSSIGTNYMRCSGVPPETVKVYPEYLRAAGYYCTNRTKTDYQFKPPASAWDDGSKTSGWATTGSVTYCWRRVTRTGLWNTTAHPWPSPSGWQPRTRATPDGSRIIR